MEIIENPDKQTLFSWKQEITLWSPAAHTIAKAAIEDALSGCYCLAAVSGGRLCAILTYYMDLFIPGHIFDDASRLPKRMDRWTIENLAGNGSGGAKMLMHEIMDRAESVNRCIYLISSDNSASWYHKFNFRTINDDDFWYIPKKMEKFRPVI